MRSLLTRHDVTQLNELYRQLPSLAWTATNRLSASPETPLEGADLERFLQAHARLVEVIERMRAVLG